MIKENKMIINALALVNNTPDIKLKLVNGVALEICGIILPITAMKVQNMSVIKMWL